MFVPTILYGKMKNELAARVTTVTRLLQGLIFGFVFTESAASTDDSSGKGPVVSTRSQSILDGLSDWLAKNIRPSIMVVSLMFGLHFLYLGSSGLLV